MGSSPTPGAILVDSSEDFINEKQQINIVKSLQEPLKEVNSESLYKERKEEIEKEIDISVVRLPISTFRTYMCT